jgi:hypothetical protein
MYKIDINISHSAVKLTCNVIQSLCPMFKGGSDNSELLKSFKSCVIKT